MIKIYSLLLLILITHCVDVDRNTFSNYHDIHVEHVHLEWLLNLDSKYINATAEYTLTMINPTDIIQFDIYQLDIVYAYLPQDGNILSHQINIIGDQSLIQGDQLQIYLPQKYTSGQQIKLRIRYSIDERARALSFMTIAQTDDKKAPYLFSQCEANNCRSMFPIQDTPSIKFTYSATIMTMDPSINVFMSGNPTNKLPLLYSKYDATIANTFHFQLDIKIPAYLVAIVAGTVKEAITGQFTSVISEEKNLQIYAKELEDLDTYVQALENYIGQYKWGKYKIVILPASFPFGGMENPLLTFANPTIIVGDKSGVSVAVHEIAHSWFGNTVTCNNWSNMWINEGFCVFLERKGLKQLYDLDFVKTNALIGNDDYKTNRKQFLDANLPSYATLHPETEGDNADDSFSTIPYEKGYQLLYYLESLIGETDFQQLLKDWLAKNEYKSADENDFYLFLLNWIKQEKPTEYSAISGKIIANYHDWVYDTSLPPVTINFSNPKSQAVFGLVQDWIGAAGREVPQSAGLFNGFQSNQKQLFLSTLISEIASVNTNMIILMENEYQLDNSLDSELLYRWFVLGIKTQYSSQQTNLEKIHQFVGKVGRMKMITPIYRIIDLQLGWAWYNEYKLFYHPLAQQSIESILKSRTQQNLYEYY